jgi:peptide chain release factor subunit 1
MQAIELAADSLSNVKFVQEKRLIQKYFDEIALDTGKFVFGIEDTLKGLEMGAVETLIVWENLDVTRYVLRNAANGAFRWEPNTHPSGVDLLIRSVSAALAEEIVIHATPEQAKLDRSKFMDKSTGLEMENAVEPQPLLEWFAEKYKDFGAALEFVTNRSQEGSQFCKGFGGIGGLLRCVLALLAHYPHLETLDTHRSEFARRHAGTRSTLACSRALGRTTRTNVRLPRRATV